MNIQKKTTTIILFVFDCRSERKTKQKMSSFKLTASIKINEEITVQRFRSCETGLTVILAHMKGPVLHAYFVVRKWILCFV